MCDPTIQPCLEVPLGGIRVNLGHDHRQKQSNHVTMMALSNVLKIIESVDRDVEDENNWNDLSPEHQEAIKNYQHVDGRESTLFSLEHFDKRKLLNLLSPDEKDAMRETNPDQKTFSLPLTIAAQKLEICCLQIENNLQAHIDDATRANNDPRTLEILQFYGKFFDRKFQRPPRQSEGVVSDTNDCSVCTVCDTLKAEQIHFNMFADESQIQFQRFKSFEMGGDRDSFRGHEEGETDAQHLDRIMARFGFEDNLRASLSPFLEDALENLICARCFLSSRPPPTLEPLTQLVFSAFLENLIRKMERAFTGTKANVVPVNGMDSVNREVEVCRNYMEMNAKRRRVAPRGTSKKTTLKIQSDFAIIEGRPNDTRYAAENSDVGIHQKQIFLHSKVNVEMKQWNLLYGRKNRSPLTQVAAESMVRYQELRQNSPKTLPETLFSLLTDCSTLYCVLHHVENKEYWISRSVSSPKVVLVGICWLFLSSIGKMHTNVRDWEIHDKDLAGRVKSESENKSCSILDSVDEEGKEEHAKDQDADGTENATFPQDTNVEPGTSMSVFRFRDDEEEEERLNWHTFFLMDNHRKYGAPLPLTEAILSLHNRLLDQDA